MFLLKMVHILTHFLAIFRDLPFAMSFWHPTKIIGVSGAYMFISLTHFKSIQRIHLSTSGAGN